MRALLALCAAMALCLAGCTGPSAPTDADAPATWSPPATLSEPAPPPGADMSERPDGTTIAVWSTRAGGQSSLLWAERHPGGVWQAGRPILDSPTPIQGPRVVVDEAGVATVAWALWDRPSGAVFAYVQVARHEPDGNWQEPVTLSRGTNGVSEVELAVQEDGRVVVAWSGSERRDGSYHAEVRSASRAPSGEWSFARVAATGAGDPFLASGGLVAVPGTTRMRLIWSTLASRGRPAAIVTATRRPDGRWTAPRRISGAEPARDLQVAHADDGTITAVWLNPDDRRLRVSQATASGGWSAPRRLATGPVETEPLVASGAGRGAVIAFETWRRRTNASFLRVIRLDADGTPAAPTTIARRENLSVSVGDGTQSFDRWSASLALEEGGRAVIAWPTRAMGPTGLPVTTGIDARVSSSDGAWGRQEQVVRLGAPAPFVLTGVDASLDQARVRWTTNAGDERVVEQSVRSR